MEALSEAVAGEFGPLHVFRPNRDVRFSKDKSPYKTACGAVTEREGGAVYYVQISAQGLYVGSGYYHPASDQLERMRAAIDDARSGPALERAVVAVERAGLEIGGDQLKTAPRGYAKDHPRIALLRRKGLIGGRGFPPAKWLSTAKAKDRVVDTWRSAEPLNAWLERHVGPSTLPPDDQL